MRFKINSTIKRKVSNKAAKVEKGKAERLAKVTGKKAEVILAAYNALQAAQRSIRHQSTNN